MNEKREQFENNRMDGQVFDNDGNCLPKATKNQSGATYKKAIAPQGINNMEDLQIPKPPLFPNIPTVDEIKQSISEQMKKKVINNLRNIFVLSSLTEDQINELILNDLPPVLRISKNSKKHSEEAGDTIYEGMKEEVTLPDIGILMSRTKTQIDLVNTFVDELNKFEDSIDDSENIKNTIVEYNERLLKSGLSYSDIVLLNMQKMMNYKIAWWNSANVLVRVWGQLNAPCQIFDDQIIVNDLIELLGEKSVLVTKIQDLLESNQPWGEIDKQELIEEIYKKYSNMNLSVIIERK